jgi:ABC-type transport system substrate-binding protein
MTLPFCINANSGMPQPALKVTDILIEQLKPAGITLDVTQQPSSAGCVDLFANQQVMPAFLVTWSGRPDPSITYNQMLATNSYYNTSRVQYGDSDTVLAELRNSFDKDTQDKIYDRLNELYLEHVPMVSLYAFVNVVAYKKGLVGEDPNLLGRPYVRTLKWEK